MLLDNSKLFLSDNEEDDLLTKVPKVKSALTLFLQLPDESYGEVIRDYEATFFEIGDNIVEG